MFSRDGYPAIDKQLGRENKAGQGDLMISSVSFFPSAAIGTRQLPTPWWVKICTQMHWAQSSKMEGQTPL